VDRPVVVQAGRQEAGCWAGRCVGGKVGSRLQWCVSEELGF